MNPRNLLSMFVPAFFSAILAAGCSLGGHRSVTVVPPPAETGPAITAHPDFTELAREVARPVNSFGEIDGRPRALTIMQANDAALQQHTICDEGYDADVCVDPTGKWLVYASTRHSQHSDIYLQRVDGSAVTQLTADPADDAQPVFSPDGKHIAFASNRAGHWNLYQMGADGKNVQQLTSGQSQEMHASFSPDGARLAYCALSGKTEQWELWILDLATGQKKMITLGLFPAWSPARGVDRIAFQRPRQRGSHAFSLWTVDLIDGEPQRLTEVASASNAALVSPAWSRDGSRLAFASIVMNPAAELRAGTPPLPQDLWVINADGAGRRKLTDGQGVNVAPSWGPAGRLFFVSDREGRENIWSTRVDEPVSASAGPAGPPVTPATGGPDEKLRSEPVGATDTREIGR